MTRRVINPDGLFDPTERGYAHARLDDGTLYLAGQVGWDEDGQLAGPGVGAQTRQAFDNLGAILDEVDRGFGDVAKVTSYFVDIRADLEGYRTVWLEYFEPPYPAHTAVGVEALAHPDPVVEVEAQVPVDG